jgi:O-antigen chain-terminating methyltransferase
LSNVTVETVDEVLAAIAAVAADGGDAATAFGIAAKQDPAGTLASLVPLMNGPDQSMSTRCGPGPFLSVADLYGFDDETFVHRAFQRILGRAADPHGLATYCGALARGDVTRVGVLVGILTSDEARGRSVRIKGLRLARTLDRIGRAPGLGRALGLISILLRLPQLIKGIEQRLSATEASERTVQAQIKAVATGTREALREVEDSLETLRIRIEETEEAPRTLEALGRRVETAYAGADAMRNWGLREAHLLSSFLADARERLSAQEVGTTLGSAVQLLEVHRLDDLYVAFENRFRGSEKEIERRLLRYVSLIRSTVLECGGRPVLDIGCGRGEWLSLLRGVGVSCHGIDSNAAMAEICRAKSLDISEGDALAFLRQSPEGAYAAVTGFHIIEHLEFPDIVSLLDAAYRVLTPGGVILFETPNPESLVVSAFTFHLDPTHKHPLPPELMRFLAQARGFDETRIIRADRDCDLSQAETGWTPNDVNSWFTAHPEYALWARRA